MEPQILQICNIFSMFKTQGHDEVNTKHRKLFSYSDVS